MKEFRKSQMVVANRDHSQKIVTKGKIFCVLNVRECPYCKMVCLDVGYTRLKSKDIPLNGGQQTELCSCGQEMPYDNVWWIASELFDHLTSTEEFKEMDSSGFTFSSPN